MPMHPHQNSQIVTCPQCHAYPLEYRTLRVTGDLYAVCANYPECAYVTPFLTDQIVTPQPKRILASY